MLILKRSALLLFIAFSLAGCATAPTYRQAAVPAFVSGGIYHIVGSGQNLYRISKAYGVDMKEVMRANNIRDPNQIGVGEKLFIPKTSTAICIRPYPREKQRSLEVLVGHRQNRVHWRTITIHHSGTKAGNAESFDRNHRRRHMGGLFYHFVIGNGSDSGDGEVEVGWRWSRQREVNRKKDIQICLVGNFNEQDLTQAQFESLLQLIKILRKEYNISLSGIRSHKDVGISECPGKNFPYRKLMDALRNS